MQLSFEHPIASEDQSRSQGLKSNSQGQEYLEQSYQQGYRQDASRTQSSSQYKYVRKPYRKTKTYYTERRSLTKIQNDVPYLINHHIYHKEDVENAKDMPTNLKKIPFNRELSIEELSDARNTLRETGLFPNVASCAQGAMSPAPAEQPSQRSNTSESFAKHKEMLDKTSEPQIINSTGKHYDKTLPALTDATNCEASRARPKSRECPVEQAKSSAEGFAVINIQEPSINENRDAFGTDICTIEDRKCVSAEAMPDQVEESQQTACNNYNTKAEECFSDHLPQKHDLLKRLRAADQVKNVNETRPKSSGVVERIHTPPLAYQHTINEVPNTLAMSGLKSLPVEPNFESEEPYTPSRRGSPSSDVIFVSSSSSSSSSDSESTSSSDSESMVKTHHRFGQNADHRSIIKSFENLVVPQLKGSLAKRYRISQAKSANHKLHFILSICTSNYNPNKFPRKQITKMHQCLQKRDYENVLPFLSQQMLQVCHKLNKKNRSKDSASPKLSDEKSSDVAVAVKSTSVDAAEKVIHNAGMRENLAVQSAQGEHQSAIEPPLASEGVGGKTADNQETENRINETAKRIETAKPTDSKRAVVYGDNYFEYEVADGEEREHQVVAANESRQLHFDWMPPVVPILNLNALRQENEVYERVSNEVNTIDTILEDLARKRRNLTNMLSNLQKEQMETEMCMCHLRQERSVLLGQFPILTKTEFSAETPTSLQLNAFSGARVYTNIAMAAPPSKIKRLSIDSEYIRHRTASTNNTPYVNSVKTSIKNNNTSYENANRLLYSIKTSEDIDIPSGNFDALDTIITQVRIVEDGIIAAAEDGKIYKFDKSNLHLKGQIIKHADVITAMCANAREKTLYTASLDGYLKKMSTQALDVDMATLNLNEPLQALDVEWDVAFIGTRNGKVYMHDTKAPVPTTCLLRTPNYPVTALKATRESARKVLIIATKTNFVQIIDASTGLLLRSLVGVECNHIYTIHLIGDYLFCGTQRNIIYKFDFVTGVIESILKSGNGAVSMQIYKEKFLIVGCYDGYIYFFDLHSTKQVDRIAGPGKMILTLELVGNKIIVAAKYKPMKVIDIPGHIIAEANGCTVDALLPLPKNSNFY